MSFSPVPQTQEEQAARLNSKSRIGTLIVTIIGGLMIALSVLATWIIVNTYTSETINGLSQPSIAGTFTNNPVVKPDEIRATLFGGWIAVILGIVVLALAILGFFIKTHNLAIAGLIVGVVALIFSGYNIVQITNYASQHFDVVGGIGIGPFLFTFGAIIAVTGSFMTFVATPKSHQQK